MIKKIKIKNFRNFKEKEISFSWDKNFVVWDNWVWKTNILEAISLIHLKKFLIQDISSIVKNDEKFAYIELESDNWNIFSISFDKEKNAKKLFINWKVTNSTKFRDLLWKVIIFQPLDMNMMYLSPWLRRDFLDDILTNAFFWYEKINKAYKNILTNRNKLLKNIFLWKAKKDELLFRDNIFIKKCLEIYDYRIKLNSFFLDNSSILKDLLNNKVKEVRYNYITKVDLKNTEESIKNYLEKNLDRDILLWSTHIWPQVDDFDIILDWYSLTDFASRWETKSVILWLKILEIKFIEKLTQKNIIFLIDDLFSELDEIHEKLLLKNLENKQVIITSIKLDVNKWNTTILNL